MDEDLDRLAQRYALKRNIKLGERLGFDIHGIVIAAQDKTKPGFFARGIVVRTVERNKSVARDLLLVTLENCRIHLPTWFAEFIRWHNQMAFSCDYCSNLEDDDMLVDKVIVTKNSY